MRIGSRGLVFMVCGALGACAFSDEEVGDSEHPLGSSHIVTCSGALPASFLDRVAARGDGLGHYVPEAGFATVTTTSPAAYQTVGCMVVADVVTDWLSPVQQVEANFGNPPSSGDDDFFFDLQWGHDAVDAPEAWSAGHRGAGVRVAVLDTGFDLTHPDLTPNINLELSADFTGEGLQYTLDDPFSHGTHTAGTIAAADNGFGVIGVAPEAELVLLKVLRDGGSGSFGDILAAVYHATAADADIASMSLGALFPRRVDTGPNKLLVAMDRAVTWARRHGVTVIASAGNEATDLDLTADLVHMPSDAAGVISVSATAPRGWATPAGSSLDFPASYSNYGRSAISVAAPGGDFVYPGSEDCTVSFVTVPCFVFDFVFSTGNGGWFWSVGTSMAAPHVAGVAALIAGEGGYEAPGALAVELERRAADLGVPGQDARYGAGRVTSGH